MAKENDTLGNLMKEYESRPIYPKAMKGLPLLARLDGKAFHTFTRGLKKPYDERMSKLMIETTKHLVQETHALVGYTQSDEISLLFFVNADDKSDYLYDGKPGKLNSIFAATASAFFTVMKNEIMPEKKNAKSIFDCRVWQVPTKELAADAFLWRELDATKNSISMAAHAHLGDKRVHGLNGSEKQELLFQEHGINWNDYPAFFKRGTYVKRMTETRELTEAELSRIPEKHRPASGTKFLRNVLKELDMPPARRCANYLDVLFSNAVPQPVQGEK